LGGGVYAGNFSATTISAGTIKNNTAPAGGGVYAAGALTISGGTFDSNVATDDGGAIYAKGDLTISATNDNAVPQFINNTTQLENSANGGAIYAYGANVNITAGTFIGNKANWGGAIDLVSSSTGSISNVKLENNTATCGGGAIASGSSATATITNCVLTGNKALGITSVTSVDNGYGGAINVGKTSGVFTFVNCTITDNTAAINGGAISVYSSVSVVINGGAISNNSAAQYGGGIYIESTGTATISSSVKITGNSCGEGYEGPNIYNNGGTLTYVDEISTTDASVADTTESTLAATAEPEDITNSKFLNAAESASDDIADRIEKINNTFAKYKAMLIRDIYDKNLLCFRPHLR
jgi:predicted outer membrane repeat protein